MVWSILSIIYELLEISFNHDNNLLRYIIIFYIIIMI